MALIERIDGLRCVDAGRLEMARITESLTALLISINARYKAHAGVRMIDPGSLMGVVVLAGGTGGAKLARGMLDVVGDDLVVVANTADDVEVYGAYVSPDPDLVHVLAGRPHRRPRLGPARRHLQRDGQLRELGVDVWFNLGDRDLAIGLRRAERLARGRHADRGARRADAPAWDCARASCR